MLERLAVIFGAVALIINRAVYRQKQFFDWYIKWRKRHRENAVDKSMSNDRLLERIVRAVKAKRKKRRDGS